jgi:hypothetical protein
MLQFHNHREYTRTLDQTLISRTSSGSSYKAQGDHRLHIQPKHQIHGLYPSAPLIDRHTPGTTLSLDNTASTRSSMYHPPPYLPTPPNYLNLNRHPVKSPNPSEPQIMVRQNSWSESRSNLGTGQDERSALCDDNAARHSGFFFFFEPVNPANTRCG